MKRESHQLDARQLGHEPDMIDARTILFWGVILFATIALAFFSMFLFKGLLDRMGDDPTIGIASTDKTYVPPGVPELNPDQAAQLIALRDWQQAWLSGYQWEDKSAEIARIPIERAMAILAKDGLPKFEPAPVNLSTLPSNE